MIRSSLIVALCVLFAAGCQPAQPPADYRDGVAVELTVATMAADRAPQPEPEPPGPYDCPRCKDTGWITHGDGHRTACPDCSDRGTGSYGGPLDAWREAKELIRKGNDLADRGKAIFDAAERDGRITVDVRIPDSSPTVGPSSCGFCPVVPVPDLPAPDLPVLPPPEAAQPAMTQGCADGVCRGRLVRRWRR